MKEYDDAAVYKVDDGSNVAGVKAEYSDEYDVPYDALKGKHLGYGFVAIVDMRREKTARLYGHDDMVRAVGDVSGYWRFGSDDSVKLYIEPLDKHVIVHRDMHGVYIEYPWNMDEIEQKEDGYKDAPDESEVIEVTATGLSFEEV